MQIKKLTSLSKWLYRNGFLQEAETLKTLMKTAIPLVDIVSLPPYSDLPPERDKFMGQNTKYYEPELWYGALSSLGTDVVLIPFDSSNMDEEVLYKLSYIWSSITDDYEELKSKVSVMSDFMSNEKMGDLEKLKEVFPELWNKIYTKLQELEIPEHEAVYIFYNEKNSPPRGRFVPEKSPRYLAHDIGHVGFDFGEEYDFKMIVYSFLREVAKFYIDSQVLEAIEDGEREPSDKEDSSLYKALEDRWNQIEDEELDKLIGDFFDTYSVETDYIADVFSNALAGDPKYSRPTHSIYYQNKEYALDSEREGELSGMESKVIEEIMDYVKNKKSGPLSYEKGYVLLYDI